MSDAATPASLPSSSSSPCAAPGLTIFWTWWAGKRQQFSISFVLNIFYNRFFFLNVSYATLF